MKIRQSSYFHFLQKNDFVKKKMKFLKMKMSFWARYIGHPAWICTTVIITEVMI